MALQRLLRESHLLDEQLAPTGKNRHKAMDLRMQALGSKTSLYAQRNMPASHRTGIRAKAKAREERRRREARENGIVLERPVNNNNNNDTKMKMKMKKEKDGQRREKGIGGPSVGRFVGGTLSLSRRDVLRVANGRKPRR